MGRPLMWRIALIAGVAVAMVAALVLQSRENGRLHRDLTTANAAIAAAQRVQRHTVAQASAGDRVSGQVIAEQAAVRTVTRTITERIPVYVPFAVDRSDILPLGFVRIHDAAAAGVPPAPESPGAPNGAPSGVALPEAAGVVADNYAAFHACRAQVEGWIALETERQRLFTESPTDGRH